MLSLWNYFRGYVIINIEGLYMEKLINMCITRDIFLWDIRRLSHTSMEAKVSIKGFKALRKLVRKSGSRIYISEKNGYPFWLNKMKKRKMLLFGAFFSFIVLLLLSSFILTIEITGNETIDQKTIIDVLEGQGLKRGTNKFFIDVKEIENNLLIEINQLAWAGVNIKGIRAIIEVVEKKEPPEKIDKNTPCDVVANKRGVVEKVIARNGDAIVKQGDIVAPGDLLITGVIKRDSMEHPMLVHAYGEVYAKTYYEKNHKINLVEVKKEKTGKAFSKISIRIGDLELALGQRENPFDLYIIEKASKNILQWRDIKLPVEVVKENYFEAKEVKMRINFNEAKNMIHDQAVKELMEEIPQEGEILNSKTSFKVEENILHGNVIIEVLENIAEQKKLFIEED
jgi:similar to stage IV sporulation protein